VSGLTQEQLKQLLHYDPETGVFTWRVDRTGTAKAGMEAGSVHVRGNVRISVNKRYYRANRLAWLYMTGEWPTVEVDHKDTDQTNNRWANLRLATRGQNACNRKAQKNNTSGFKGVSLYKPTGRWLAQIRIKGQHRHLGYHATPEEAHAAYCKASKELHGEFGNTEVK